MSAGGVAAIIPAYNEERTLGPVIDAVKRVPAVAEVVVVSDGSRDRTAAVARERGAHCVELPQNVGKGGAIKAGIDQTQSDILLFLDADLIGLEPYHVEKIIGPVLSGDADVAIGFFGQGRMVTDLAQLLTPNLSGQRALRRYILAGMTGFASLGFGVEAALTRYIRENHIKVIRVPLDRVTHVMKEEKFGLRRGLAARMRMYRDILMVRLMVQGGMQARRAGWKQ